jgi:hypothetical protein
MRYFPLFLLSNGYSGIIDRVSLAREVFPDEKERGQVFLPSGSTIFCFEGRRQGWGTRVRN